MRGVAAVTAAVLATAFLAAAQAVAQPPAGDEEAGRETFNAECRTCHNGAIAPALRGVLGRPIAGAADFGGYSEALKSHGAETWTEAGVDTFLKAPAAFAPGTRMEMAVPDDQKRADLIAYLKAISQPAP